ncbi:MAG: DUF4145 domain-containing protein [candidate division Zixibacteria bacterium]|nr:DUF4145 domain-containing protein [candidate division Zixibacteria bacterium]
MLTDNLVKKRFAELTDKAHAIQKTRKLSGEGVIVDAEILIEWATSVLSLLQRVTGKDSVYCQHFSKAADFIKGWHYEFAECRAVFKAAREDYEGGYLFDLRSLVMAEVLSDNVLETAKELLEKGYKDSAAVLCRVALETTLKERCTREDISHGKLDRMNADLCKAGVYNMARQKQITAWAEIGNKAAHGKWNEYTAEDVKDFLSGVERFIADCL